VGHRSLDLVENEKEEGNRFWPVEKKCDARLPGAGGKAELLQKRRFFGHKFLIFF